MVRVAFLFVCFASVCAHLHRRGPRMLNGGRPVPRDWTRKVVATSSSDARSARNDEAAIFAQGRALRQREADLRKRMAACPEHDHFCKTLLIEEAKHEERARGANELKASQHLVTDAFGRTMPLLFTEKSGATAQSVAFSVFAWLFVSQTFL
mmetsp:Transcript_9962/g.27853  ORF Transcript_9962/g.27853 Transcript_9962/m.27853 type:complete len:152 (-) Transcript_9962:76-531(-)